MKKERIILWGAGYIASKMLEFADLEQFEIIGLVDNDSNRQNTPFLTFNVYHPDVLNEVEVDRIVIMSYYVKEITEQIEKEYPQYKNKISNQYYLYKKNIQRRYLNSDDPEIGEVLAYLDNHDLRIFNYPFADEMELIKTDIRFDEEAALFYTLHNTHKLYFSEEFNTYEKAEKYYKGILLEQNVSSPHRYLDESFDVKQGDIIVDVGAAEGNFAIDIVDKAAKIYLIETDERWIKALKYTFKDYKDKVIIIKTFITSYDDGKYSKLDSFIREPVNFIKMDIEGAEWDALCGAENLLEISSDVKLAICAYHSDFDQYLIEDYMDKHAISHSTTKGYMWFPYMVKQSYISSHLSRGIIRGWKEKG